MLLIPQIDAYKNFRVTNLMILKRTGNDYLMIRLRAQLIETTYRSDQPKTYIIEARRS